MNLNNHILKILICTIVLLIGIGAVSAIDSNSSDDVMSAEQNDEIDNEVLSVEDNSGDALSADENRQALKAGEGDTATSGQSQADNTIQTTTQYKTLVLGKLKIPKKYMKMDKLKKNSKKYKKMDKQLNKLMKKQNKKIKKTTKKAVKKAMKNHWYSKGDVYYTMKKTAKNYVYTYKINCYRIHNFDPATNKSWWSK